MKEAVKKPASKKHKGLLVIVFVIVIAFILVALRIFDGGEVSNVIDSFEDCAAAGYPIMESYPERCAVPGGDTYTKNS